VTVTSPEVRLPASVSKGGIIVTILLGIVGALVGGFISTRLGFGDVTGFNIQSIIIAVLGAMLLLFIYRMVKSRS
jgi:uncharacterized membrane protein YeaQ/YmgE (transglycosylase-associated protein family)